MARTASIRITNRSRRYTVPEGLLLCDIRLLDHFMDDIVFVSIDFEGEDNFFDEPGIIHPVSVGISILDTRHLDTNPTHMISARSLCFMSSRQFKDTDNHFLFGTSEELPYVTTKVAIQQKLNEYLFQQDPQNSSRPRKVVLVTFDARGEAVIMEHLGIQLIDQSSLVGILDIQHEMMRILGVPPNKRPDELWSFEESLEACNCSYGNLHVGGNDAYFNLQLLLSLTSIECGRQSNTLAEAEQNKLSKVHNIRTNSLRIDRATTPATFEYRGDMNWRKGDFRKRASKYIRNSLPEVQEARRAQHLAELERRKEVKENNETWRERFDGIEGFSHCFEGFESEQIKEMNLLRKGFL